MSFISFDALRQAVVAGKTDPVTTPSSAQSLVHLPNKSINLIFSVTQVTTFNEMTELSGTETTGGVAQFERPLTSN